MLKTVLYVLKVWKHLKFPLHLFILSLFIHPFEDVSFVRIRHKLKVKYKIFRPILSVQSRNSEGSLTYKHQS